MFPKEFMFEFFDNVYTLQIQDEKNYSIVKNNTKINTSVVMKELDTILGESKGIIKIFEEWCVDKFYSAKNTIVNYVEGKVINNKGHSPVKILEIILGELPKIKGVEYGGKFIDDKFTDFTFNLVFNDDLKKLIEEKPEHRCSIYLIDSMNAKSDGYTKNLLEKYKKNILSWYFNNFVENKVYDLFSELIIILGKENWEVRWVGHGNFNKKKLRIFFLDDVDEIYNKVELLYDEWYLEKVIGLTEKNMN